MLKQYSNSFDLQSSPLPVLQSQTYTCKTLDLGTTVCSKHPYMRLILIWKNLVDDVK